MDKDDFKYADFIFLTLKGNRKMLASAITEFAHTSSDELGVKMKKIKFVHIFDFLADLSLIDIEYNSDGRGLPQVIKITPIGERSISVEDRIREIRYAEFNSNKKKEQEETDKNLDREYKKRQIWLAKYWYFTTIVSAFIGALLQKFFDLI